MMCNNLETYLEISDFDCVGLVARHCDLNKLCIATEEAKNFDLIPLFCFPFVNDVLKQWNVPEFTHPVDDPNVDIPNPDFDPKYKDLVCGGSFIDGNGATRQNMGLKRVWVYYAYARYLLINQMNDTPNGAVAKTSEWSVPTPYKDVVAFSNKYREMGREAFNTVTDYLCTNRDIWPLFDGRNCRKACGCNGACSCGKTKKITGFKFSTIKK